MQIISEKIFFTEQASAGWGGRIRYIHLGFSSSQLHIPFLPPPRLLFLLFPPKTHCSCSLSVVKAQLGSGTGREQFWGAGLRWAPDSHPQLLFCAQSLVAHRCHHPQLLLGPQGQVFQTPLLVLYEYKAPPSALLMGNNHICP